MLVAINRRYIIRQSAPGSRITCAECGAPVLTAEQAANIFGIKQRRIFQIIEAEAAHYTETEAGAVMICIKALQKILDGEETIAPTNSSRLETAPR